MPIVRRRARLADLGQVLALARLFHGESGAPFVFDEAAAARTARHLITHPDAIVAVLDGGSGTLVGVLAAAVAQHPFGGFRMATELMWFVTPAARGSRDALGLVVDFEVWARAKGCALAAMGGLASNDKTAALYRRRGYRSFETNYLKDLSTCS